MSSTASPTTRLPSAIARLTALARGAAPAGPRHLASDAADFRMDAVAAGVLTQAASGTGRHTESEWGRDLFDPRRDDDPFVWLGFTDEDGTQDARRTSAITGTSASNAWPRWLRASFSAGSSSAEVTVSPSGTKTGS
jgi:hypothetical protein